MSSNSYNNGSTNGYVANTTTTTNESEQVETYDRKHLGDGLPAALPVW